MRKGVFYNLLLYIGNEWGNLLSRNRDMVLNRTKDFY